MQEKDKLFYSQAEKTDLSYLPAKKTEDIKRQIKYGEGSECDEEKQDSQASPSPDGQTGLKKQTPRTHRDRINDITSSSENMTGRSIH